MSAGDGNLSPFEINGDLDDLQVRLVNNSTGQIIGMDSDQGRVTARADGSVVINFEDCQSGDNDFNDAVVTLSAASGTGSVETGAPSFDFDTTALVELLETLETITDFVDTSQVDEGVQQSLIGQIADLTQLVVAALGEDSDGGPTFQETS